MKHQRPADYRDLPVPRKLAAGWLLTVFMTGTLLPAVLALAPLPASAQCGPGGCSPPVGARPPANPLAIGGALGLLGGGALGIPGALGPLLGALGSRPPNLPPSGIGGDQGQGGVGGALGGMLGGLLQDPMMLLLLIMFLQQMFGGKGGGSTPQRGPAEEQPPYFPDVGPQRTVPRDGAVVPPPAATTSPLAESTCAYIVSSTGITPPSCAMQAGASLRITNADTTSYTIYSDPHDPARATPGGVTSACSALAPNESCRVFFLRAGTFGFHDHNQPDRRATVIVQ